MANKGLTRSKKPFTYLWDGNRIQDHHTPLGIGATEEAGAKRQRETGSFLQPRRSF